MAKDYMEDYEILTCKQATGEIKSIARKKDPSPQEEGEKLVLCQSKKKATRGEVERIHELGKQEMQKFLDHRKNQR